MKKIIFFLLVVLSLSACDLKDKRIKSIIDESDYGLHGLVKVGEIDKIQENIYALPVHYTDLDTFITTDPEADYFVVRHIYSTYKGAYRMFYIINYTDEFVVKKSSDFESFYRPIFSKMFKHDISHMKGDNLMELMRY